MAKIFLHFLRSMYLSFYKHPAENPLLSSGEMNAFNKLKLYCKWQALMNNSIIYT